MIIDSKLHTHLRSSTLCALALPLVAFSACGGASAPATTRTTWSAAAHDAPSTAPNALPMLPAAPGDSSTAHALGTPARPPLVRADVTTPTYPAADAWGPGEGMESAVTRVGVSTQIAEAMGYGFDGTGCIRGAFLAVDQTIAISRVFEGGEQYHLLGAGAEGVTDIDLLVTDEAGRAIARDLADDAIPIVDFTPRATGTYVVHLKMAAARSRGAFAALAVMRRHGYRVPKERLDASFDAALNIARVIARANPGLVFHANGDWSLHSAIVSPGFHHDENGLAFRPGSHAVMIAGGDGASADIDLNVSRAGATVAADSDDDATPAVDFVAQSSGPYRVSTENARSNGPSVITTLILEL